MAAPKSAPSAGASKAATPTAKKAAKAIPARAASANGASTTRTAPIRAAASKAATATKKAPARAAATKATPAKAATASTKTAAKATASKAAATTAATKAAPAKAAAPRRSSKVVLPVRGDEKPWTAAELRSVRSEIESDIEQLQSEIDQAEAELVGLMRDSGDGAGDDQADAGTKTYEREQEMTVANNAREMLIQNEHALERIQDGTYGVCESCGKPIGKLRLQAAPRATLCLECKKKQERR